MNNLLGGIAIVIGVIVLIALLLGLPLMFLWNWLMPTIFGLPHITFWQAIGLNILSTVLFSTKNVSKNKS